MFFLLCNVCQKSGCEDDEMKKHKLKVESSRKLPSFFMITCQRCGVFWFANNLSLKDRLVQIKNEVDCDKFLALRIAKRLTLGKKVETTLAEIRDWIL
jgi:hypothetical protein